MKKTIIALLASTLLVGTSVAQVSINSTNFTFADNFTGFLGTGNPTNWTTTDSGTWRGTNAGSGATGGKYSYGNTGTEATFDGSLGFLPSGSLTLNADISFTNNSGSTLTSFTLGYVAEHWRSTLNGRNNGWAVSFSIDGGSFTNLTSLSYVAPNNIATGAGPHGSTSLSQTQSMSLANNSTIQFRFFGDNGTGAGARQGVAIDNVSLIVIPEPHEYALMFAGLLGLVIVMRRMRSNRAAAVA